MRLCFHVVCSDELDDVQARVCVGKKFAVYMSFSCVCSGQGERPSHEEGLRSSILINDRVI